MWFVDPKEHLPENSATEAQKLSVRTAKTVESQYHIDLGSANIASFGLLSPRFLTPFTPLSSYEYEPD
jgi:hypothetical protein